MKGVRGRRVRAGARGQVARRGLRPSGVVGARRGNPAGVQRARVRVWEDPRPRPGLSELLWGEEPSGTTPRAPCHSSRACDHFVAVVDIWSSCDLRTRIPGHIRALLSGLNWETGQGCVMGGGDSSLSPFCPGTQVLWKLASPLPAFCVLRGGSQDRSCHLSLLAPAITPAKGFG